MGPPIHLNLVNRAQAGPPSIGTRYFFTKHAQFYSASNNAGRSAPDPPSTTQIWGGSFRIIWRSLTGQRGAR